MLLLVASNAIACQCGVLDLSRRVAEADLILVATVSSFKALEHVTVSPGEVFKGSASKALTIRTGLSDCDYFLPPVSPKVGEEYLLFLQQDRWPVDRQSLPRFGPYSGESGGTTGIEETIPTVRTWSPLSRDTGSSFPSPPSRRIPSPPSPTSAPRCAGRRRSRRSSWRAIRGRAGRSARARRARRMRG